ncbi:hypothetical protein SE19_04615 [Acidiplasma aeolicum]|uniref:Multipass membrane protein n=1 Tax=Acidiplasma aeolicum TaxID=507754 RepID=A0A0P9ES47_9ARCH|nr:MULTISPECIES: hypothetical protein [Acidiplasma]KPV46642.1 hypothetical protein SE19_04615 [Acidiplasma aeolicum]
MLITSRAFVEISVIIILLLTAGLTSVIFMKYQKNHGLHLLYWGLGLLVFVISVFLELLMAAGIFSRFLIDLYLFLVAILVDFLAMGSFALFGNKKYLNYYYLYTGLASIFLLITLIIYPVGKIIIHHIVFGPLPLMVVVSSSFVSFPAAFFIILIAALSYKKSRNIKLLSIIAGVIVVSIAGTLYIAAIPVFLYYAEFIGILLLWIGFK